MPRSAAAPPFPDSPGAWLTCYRWRMHGIDDRPLSPETLGATLGVSGPTVRRWERGLAKPAPQDLANLAAVCKLKPFEAEFLYRAFQSSDADEYDAASFASLAGALLGVDYPTVLIDRFYFVRGYNSYVSLFHDPTIVTSRWANLLLKLFEDEDDGAEFEAIRNRLLLDFWLSSAPSCGTIRYRSVLTRLRQVRDFERRWWDLALGRADTAGAWAKPFMAPFSFGHNTTAAFRVYPTSVAVPPAFQLLEFRPTDDLGRHRIEALVRAGPPAVFVDGKPVTLRGRHQVA